jgi:MFS family permease
MSSPVSDRMSPEERRAGASLASIFALRMLGLFLILPVFSVYAKTLPGGDNLALVGFALGAYGLTQAFFQIPYGIASDIWGRKLVIVIGLLIFALGSFVAAWAPDMNWIIVGRVLQGAGAISAAVTALAADLTREEHRTKVMAMIGSSIGLVFALSLVGAPLLYGWVGMGGIFSLTGILALAGIVLLLKAVPPAPAPNGHAKLPLRQVILDPDLFRLNVGIFVLHMVQMAMFVVVPARAGQSWWADRDGTLAGLSARGAGFLCHHGAGDYCGRAQGQNVADFPRRDCPACGCPAWPALFRPEFVDAGPLVTAFLRCLQCA